jgi:hypothetical protein
MKGMIGTLSGFPIFESIYAINQVRKFTKKQTRKFKNHRWVKKYIKKYSYFESKPGAFFDSINQRYYIHPEVLKSIIVL